MEASSSSFAPRAINRNSLSQSIVQRIDAHREDLIRQWRESAPINYFVLDDLLPEEVTSVIRAAFPDASQLTLKNSLKERKLVGVQMDRYDTVLEEAVYAFQTDAVLQRIEEITGIPSLEPDARLYAGGISMMGPGHFLNPHVDNSHDKDRSRYRVLNLLFYTSPGWDQGKGCNLELWPSGLSGEPLTIVSRFNRLVVMVTHRKSWHSVSENRSSEQRCCVSNYYFSKSPVDGGEYAHLTNFRGRPEQKIRDLILRADIFIRNAARRVFPRGIKENRHFYQRNDDERNDV